MDIKDLMAVILNNIQEKQTFSWKTLNVKKEYFFDALRLIKDGKLAVNIVFASGGQNKILVAFYDTACITLDGIEYLSNYKTSLKDNKQTENNSVKKLFISYSWSDNDIVNEIDLHFAGKGIMIKRDNRDIANWTSIHSYMDTIKSQDYVIFIISKKYLESVNCMYEVSEFTKDINYKDKIMTLVLDKKIYTVEERIRYINYWETECSNLEKQIKTINIENAAEISFELRKRKRIATTMAEFLDFVADINNPQIENFISAIENKLQI